MSAAADQPDSAAMIGESPDLSAVPLFPLPGVVLFPRAVLPLHVFEHRYRLMTSDALTGDRLVAMALLKHGWETNYHGRPGIEPVVCVGRIISWEQLDDGKYNFLLQGMLRATLDREFTDRTYRYAAFSPMVQRNVMEIDVTAERERLAELFATRPLASTCLAKQFRQLLAGPVPTSDVADLIAFHFIEQISTKQALLADRDARSRIRRVVGALESMLPLTAMLMQEDEAAFN